MRWYASFILFSLAMLAGCARTVLVSVPPRMDLSRYGTLAIIDFASTPDHAVARYATRKFQEQIQRAQPGTPIVALGSRKAALTAVGVNGFDVETFRKIGEKFGVGAVFIGELIYSDATTDVRVSDIAKLEGSMRSEVRGDLSSRLIDTSSGASVWSSSAWARRHLGHVGVSAEQGVGASMDNSDPRYDMVPALVFHLSQDFRPGREKRPAK